LHWKSGNTVADGNIHTVSYSYHHSHGYCNGDRFSLAHPNCNRDRDCDSDTTVRKSDNDP